MGKKKIIIDNNVLISGLGWKGTPRIILKQVIEGKYHPGNASISIAKFDLERNHEIHVIGDNRHLTQ